MALVGLVKIPPTFGQVVRNDQTRAYGYRFRMARTLTVAALGRFAGSVLNQSHDVRLWDDAANLLAVVTIFPSTPIDGDGYRFLAIANTVLTFGAYYRLASNEFASGDNWLDSGQTSAAMQPPNTLSADFDPAEFDACNATSSPWYPVNLGAANVSFGKHQLYEFVPDPVYVRLQRRGSGKVGRPGRYRALP